MSGSASRDIALYHASWCRSLRVKWLLAELKLPYDVIKLKFSAEDLQDQEYLRIHPLGQLPALKYGKTTLWESGAILDFLTRVQPAEAAPLLPQSDDVNIVARYLQFFHFGEAIMTPIHDIVAHTHDLPPESRVPEIAERAKQRLGVRLAYLDEEMALRGPFVLGDQFSVADIMLGYSLANLEHFAPAVLKGFASCEHVTGYLRRLQTREAYKTAFEDELNRET